MVDLKYIYIFYQHLILILKMLNMNFAKWNFLL